MSNARLTITISYTFFGYLLAGLEIVALNLPGLTIATDGYKVVYSPRFLEGLDNQELIFVICHEVLHCALEHISRRKGREPFIWNIAIDIITNEILIQNRIGKMPNLGIRGKNVLPEKLFMKEKQISRSAEEIYREIMLRSKEMKIKWSSNFDQHHETSEKRKEKQDERKLGEPRSLIDIFGSKKPETDWKRKLAEATVFSRSRGSSPLGIKEEYEVAVKGHFSWQRLLAQYVQQTLAYDTTFGRPNRRYVSRNMYLPATEKWNLAVVIAIDTSGSIRDQEARLFIGETFAILGQFPQIEIIVIQCDSDVQEVKKFTNWMKAPSKFQFKGRGGTDFRPVFSYIEKKRILPDVVIYLTDGHGIFPEKKPFRFPVFWVLTEKDVKPPFGRSIYFTPITST